MTASARCPAILDQAEKKRERKKGVKNTRATGEREIYRTCRDETEMAEKLNRHVTIPIVLSLLADKYEWQGY